MDFQLDIIFISISVRGLLIEGDAVGMLCCKEEKVTHTAHVAYRVL
jgi:hypothetical protein